MRIALDRHDNATTALQIDDLQPLLGGDVDHGVARTARIERRVEIGQGKPLLDPERIGVPPLAARAVAFGAGVGVGLIVPPTLTLVAFIARHPARLTELLADVIDVPLGRLGHLFIDLKRELLGLLGRADEAIGVTAIPQAPLRDLVTACAPISGFAGRLGRVDRQGQRTRALKIPAAGRRGPHRVLPLCVVLHHSCGSRENGFLPRISSIPAMALARLA